MTMTRALFLILVILTIGCSSDDEKTAYCNVDNPVEDLPWLKAELQAEWVIAPSTFSDTFVYQAIYLGQPVFYIAICCPTCNVAAPSVQNCNGDVLGSIGVEIAQESLQNVELIWRTDNGVCP